MLWNDLRKGFEALRDQGDFDAGWRFAPDEAPSEKWRIIADEDCSADQAIVEYLVVAGKLLSVTLEGTRALPQRLLAHRRSPAACWLGALRRKGLNVVREPSEGWRVDEGRIINVVEASIALCSLLQSSATARKAAASARAPHSLATDDVLVVPELTVSASSPCAAVGR